MGKKNRKAEARSVAARKHNSFTVQSAILKGDDLVGIGIGAVNDLAPGQTKTASLVVIGEVPDSSKATFGVDTVVQ